MEFKKPVNPIHEGYLIVLSVKMIEILESILYGKNLGPYQVKKKPVEVKAEEQKPQTPTSVYAEDIETLRREYGDLTAGMTINLSLQRALELMPRTRKRSDAYKGLRNELMRLYGVALNVGNNNTPIDKNYE